MAKNSTLSILKLVIYEMMDHNGNFRALPIGKLGKLKLKDDRIMFIQSVLNLFLNTDFLKYETKLYIKEEGLTLDRLYDRLQDDPNFDGVSKNTVRMRIYRDQNKIDLAFGEDMILNIAYLGKPFSNYAQRVAKEYAKLSDNELRNKVRLNIPNENISVSCDDAVFSDFMATIMPYIDSQMSSIESNLDAEAVGYFNYLLSSPDACLSSHDLDKKESLLLVLTGQLNDTYDDIID